MIKLAKIRDVKVPQRGTSLSAGLDFFIPNDYTGKCVLVPSGSVLIPSGIKAKVPNGYMLTAFNKSGISVNKSLVVGACVIDEDYQGEIHIHVINVGNNIVEIAPGDKIVQFILVPISLAAVEVVDEQALFLEDSERGSGGFGSTGLK
jgi:dUTP pyrophosphatase